MSDVMGLSQKSSPDGKSGNTGETTQESGSKSLGLCSNTGVLIVFSFPLLYIVKICHFIKF